MTKAATTYFQLLVLIVVLISYSESSAQSDYLLRTYKTVGSESLVVHVFAPKASRGARPAVVLFHGGGFVWGGPEVTDGSAREYAAMGFVAFSVQYRLANRSTVTPIEQVEDACDAIRWVRTHASEFGVDRKRIVAYGDSAGGFLAAMTIGVDDKDARPNALVLWSPGVGAADPYVTSLFAGRVEGRDFFPIKRIGAPVPPTIIISGERDAVTGDKEAREYCKSLSDAKGRCEIHSYPNLGHLLSRRLDPRAQQLGDFDFDPIATKDANEKVTAFLRSLGYLKGH